MTVIRLDEPAVRARQLRFAATALTDRARPERPRTGEQAAVLPAHRAGQASWFRAGPQSSIGVEAELERACPARASAVTSSVAGVVARARDLLLTFDPLPQEVATRSSVPVEAFGGWFGLIDHAGCPDISVDPRFAAARPAMNAARASDPGSPTMGPPRSTAKSGLRNPCQ